MAIQKFHQFLAVTMHPVLVTFYGLAYVSSTHVVAYGRMVESQTMWFIVILFLSTAIIPLLTLGLLFKKFTVSEWAAVSLKERQAAAIVMGIVYIALFFTYQDFFPDKAIGVFLIAAGVSSVVAGVLQSWFRISFHMFAMAGLLVLVLYMAGAGVDLLESKWSVTCVIGITGVVGWSRLATKAHRPVELYLGYCIGLLASTAVFYFAYGI